MKGKVSKTGYKRTSPDRNNDYNIIPSGRITMQDVDFPVYGVDNFGNEQMMYPGGEYQFPGNQVFELPIAQVGGQRDTIYTPNPNDPRLKAYQDSLYVRRLNPQTFRPGSRTRPLTPDEKIFWKDEKTGLVPNLVEYNPKIPTGGYFGHYKKPVQPVEYKPSEKAIVKPKDVSFSVKKKDFGPQKSLPKSIDSIKQDASGVNVYVTINGKTSVIPKRDYSLWIAANKDLYDSYIAERAYGGEQLPGVLEEYGKGGLTQWFDEKWVDVKTGEECGRSGKDKDGRPYPACRPSRRVNETTPKTASEMSSAEKAKFKRSKTSGERIDYNHKRAQEGGEQRQPTSWLDYANPMNWGVSTYDDAGTFNQAFAKARGEGQDEFMWYGNRYNTQLAPQSEQTTVNDTPPARPSDDIDLDFNALKKGVSFVESRNGKYMWNPESSATGLYGQRFSEIGDTPLYGGTRENFRDDTEAQERVFGIRYNDGLPGSTSLKKDAIDLYREYYPIVKKNNIAPTELAALSNFLGRQGTRYYLGYVLRDGKNLSEVFPKLYGDDVAQKNKTPEEYLKLFREAAYAEEVGGEVEEKYPDYSEYDTSSGAWMAARKELGKNKQFKYGGKVMSTCTPNGY